MQLRTILSDLIIPVVALVASLLTLISGFGLGTLLLPVFALFFPLELAVALTAAAPRLWSSSWPAAHR